MIDEELFEMKAGCLQFKKRQNLGISSQDGAESKAFAHNSVETVGDLSFFKLKSQRTLWIRQVLVGSNWFENVRNIFDSKWSQLEECPSTTISTIWLLVRRILCMRNIICQLCIFTSTHIRARTPTGDSIQQGGPQVGFDVKDAGFLGECFGSS